MAQTDLLDSVKDLLTTNWNISNTASRTPSISNIFENKRIDFVMGGSTDHILLYEDSQDAVDGASGGGIKHKVNIITIDVRTMHNRAQGILIRNEIERIIVANEVNPFSSDPFYDIADVTSLQDLSDKSVKLYRFVLKLKLERFTQTF